MQSEEGCCSQWRSETLAKLQLRFPTKESLLQFQRDHSRPFLHAVCIGYAPNLRLLPVLQWLCSPPHSMAIDESNCGYTPLMLVAERGLIQFIADVLACGAKIHTRVQNLNVMDVVITSSWLGEQKKSVLLYLLDRRRQTRPVYFLLPDYANCFLAQRESIRHSAVAFLRCYKRNAWFRRYLDRHTAALIAQLIWRSRFDV